MAENKENKQQITTLSYEQEKMQYALNLLNSLQVSGFNNINALKAIFDVLGNPINDESLNKKQ